jgi:hypothetical protein
MPYFRFERHRLGTVHLCLVGLIMPAGRLCRHEFRWASAHPHRSCPGRSTMPKDEISVPQPIGTSVMWSEDYVLEWVHKFRCISRRARRRTEKPSSGGTNKYHTQITHSHHRRRLHHCTRFFRQRVALDARCRRLPRLKAGSPSRVGLVACKFPFGSSALGGEREDHGPQLPTIREHRPPGGDCRWGPLCRSATFARSRRPGRYHDIRPQSSDRTKTLDGVHPRTCTHDCGG